MKLFITAFLIFFAVPAAQGACGRAGVGGPCPYNPNNPIPPGTPPFEPGDRCYGITHGRIVIEVDPPPGPNEQLTAARIKRDAERLMGMEVDPEKVAEILERLMKNQNFLSTVSLDTELALNFLTQRWASLMVVMIYNTELDARTRGITINPLIAQALGAFRTLARDLWAQKPLAAPLRGAFVSLAIVLKNPAVKKHFLRNYDAAAVMLTGIAYILNQQPLSDADRNDLNKAIKSVDLRTT